MSEKRKLAAIVFTDIVGYTKIMSKDENKALQILQKNRDIQKSLVKKFNGEFLKEIGDGTLLCFESTLDAVNCALELQRELRDDPELNLRIGIHLGDIVFKDGDIFGNGVNIASRIEQISSAGGISITEQVYNTIRNKPDINAVYLGEKKLKNVDHLIKVYSISAEGMLDATKVSLMKDLFQRRVPQILGGYILISFVVITFMDWLVGRYPVSPYLTDFSLAILVSMVPTVLLIAYFHGMAGYNRWTRIERFPQKGFEFKYRLIL